MRIRNLKQVDNKKVNDWLCDIIPDITPEQENALMDNIEDRRICPYYFYESYKRKAKPMMRFTILFLFIFSLLILLAMPINYFITGEFRYTQTRFMKFYEMWLYAVFP